jgi:hypothetical protein
MRQAAGPKQKQDNQDNHAYATDGVEAPLVAVRPNRKTTRKRYEDNYGKNEHHHHLFALPFWPAPAGLSQFRVEHCAIRKAG